MFLIPTYVDRSPIHGFGVFSAVPVSAGTVIWKFADGVDLRLTQSELDAMPSGVRDFIRPYCYREASGTYVLCGDNAKFMNHADHPSCDDDGVITVVHKDLPPGAELTCDYRVFDHETINGQGEWFTESAPRVRHERGAS